MKKHRRGMQAWLDAQKKLREKCEHKTTNYGICVACGLNVRAEFTFQDSGTKDTWFVLSRGYKVGFVRKEGRGYLAWKQTGDNSARNTYTGDTREEAALAAKLDIPVSQQERKQWLP